MAEFTKNPSVRSAVVGSTRTVHLVLARSSHHDASTVAFQKPGPQKHARPWPLGLSLAVLGNRFADFGDLGKGKMVAANLRCQQAHESCHTSCYGQHVLCIEDGPSTQISDS